MIWILLLYFLTLLAFLPAYYFASCKELILSTQHSLFLSLAATISTVFLIAAMVNNIILLTLLLIKWSKINRIQRGSLS